MTFAWGEQFSMEEKDAYFAERKQEVAGLFAKLDEALTNLGSAGHFQHYLKQMARFHEYSTRNTMLIGIQDPEATRVASFSTWKALGRSVNRGEKGIRILAPVVSNRRRKAAVIDPQTGLYVRESDGSVREEETNARVLGFKPVSVFDVRQTSGEPVPEPLTTLTGDVPKYEELFQALVEASGVRVGHSQLPEGMYGLCEANSKCILLTHGMSQAQEFKTFLHEIAHCHLHSSDQAEDLPRPDREIQAEAAAFVVAAHFGIDTSDYSVGYIDSWGKAGSGGKMRAALEPVSRFAGALISATERILGIEPLSELARSRQAARSRTVRRER